MNFWSWVHWFVGWSEVEIDLELSLGFFLGRVRVYGKPSHSQTWSSGVVKTTATRITYIHTINWFNETLFNRQTSKLFETLIRYTKKFVLCKDSLKNIFAKLLWTFGYLHKVEYGSYIWRIIVWQWKPLLWIERIENVIFGRKFYESTKKLKF
jgi:hypothetical protein